jgi:hypothetical protein
MKKIVKKRTVGWLQVRMTFENNEKRRAYFLEKLREKLKDPGFRKIEGFPIGEETSWSFPIPRTTPPVLILS